MSRVWSFPSPDDRVGVRAPLTEEDWSRVLRGRQKTVVFLVAREQREWAGDQAHSCGSCKNVKMHGDPRRGFCAAQRMMTSLAFPVLCRRFA